jgi:hypothetical protein
VLPNNKNIVFAADQAKYLCGGKPMTVIPTKSLPQGVSALLGFEAEGNLDNNVESMNETMQRVKTGQITHAVRDTVVNDIRIEEGDYLFLYDGNIEGSGKDILSGTEGLFEKMIDDETEFVTIYYGADVTAEQADEILGVLSEKYDMCEFEVHNGGQPVYSYIFSVE